MTTKVSAQARRALSSSLASVKLDWTQIIPDADPEHGKPCSRSSHGLSMVHKGSRLVLYGGEETARTPLGALQATWAADAEASENASINAWAWRLIDSPISSDSPPARVAHAQAVYNDSVVYVFGGRAGITMEEKPMNDLWKLDCSGAAGTETWSLVTPDIVKGGAPPEARSFHRMLCVGSNLYVFGGCGAGGRLSDMHMFDIDTNMWLDIGTSELLEGRGGPNFMTFSSGALLGVVAGFCGKESNDGHLFDVSSLSWQETDMADELEGLRPRSVCVSASLPSTGVSVIFGGEVDPSQKGHEGAGGFENDIVLLDECTGKYVTSIQASDALWPELRGWSAGTSLDNGNGVGKLFVFGGLSGDDSDPKRLDDLWRLDILKT